MLAELVDVAGELPAHVQEGYKDRDVQHLAGEREIRHLQQQEHTAHQRKGHIEDVADIADDGAKHARIGVGTQAVVVERIVDPVKAFETLPLVAEDLDHLLALHHFLGEALHRGGGFLLPHEVGGGAAADDFGDEEHRHDAEQQHKRQPDAEIEHDREHDQHCRARADQRGDRLAHKLAQGIDVIGIEAHDVAGLVPVEIADRQILHPVEELPAHLVEEALGHHGHDLRLK